MGGGLLFWLWKVNYFEVVQELLNAGSSSLSMRRCRRGHVVYGVRSSLSVAAAPAAAAAAAACRP